MSPSATVIVPTVTPALAAPLLGSLAAGGGGFETILVDNGTGAAELERAASRLDGCELLRLESNLGYSRAVNLAARQAEGATLVLLNDDSMVDPGYVERITGALDPGAGVVMAAGVMLDAARPGLIDTAGILLDRTLLAYDYLNGQPIGTLESPVPDPLGPSGAAAAVWREAFVEAGGFDEKYWMYLEDVDLVLRLRRAGGSCRLAQSARGTHRHSTTLGAGSARKDYLAGYGRGYLLRKWGVLTARRLPEVLARELVLCGGQALFDRNLAGVRGRLRGLRDARTSESYPESAVSADPPRFAPSLWRRWRRRRVDRGIGEPVP
jgi:N-acetylglucosaminyl-diphospho-decaprenol L-rhamnosyltransferase